MHVALRHGTNQASKAYVAQRGLGVVREVLGEGDLGDLVESDGGRRAPEFLSDHPDPGNRVASINEALPSLPVRRDAVRDTREFAQVKARLAGGRRAAAGALSSTAEPERRGPENPNDMEPAARPPRPSETFGEYAARDGSFTLAYPENWDALAS